MVPENLRPSVPENLRSPEREARDDVASLGAVSSAAGTTPDDGPQRVDSQEHDPLVKSSLELLSAMKAGAPPMHSPYTSPARR
jgi:hypothetical protein